MPDLATHLLAVTPFLKRTVRRPELVLLGAVLPDLVGRMSLLLPERPFFFWADTALHTPFSAALVILGLALLFPEDRRREAILSLGFGAAFHFALDMMQRSVTFGTPWLFPFSMASFQLPIIWGDESFYALPALILINFLVFRRPLLARLRAIRRRRGA